MTEEINSVGITKPMLAVNFDPNQLKFPVFATPKIDGIRCIKVSGQALSRTFKPIPNHHIRNLIEMYLPDGVDGELISGKNFQESSSAVMTRDGSPFFTYVIFDFVINGDIAMSYEERMFYLNEMFMRLDAPAYKFVTALLPKPLLNIQELQEYEESCVNSGYEGVMLRNPNGPYKCGRSTVREGYLLKVKRFEDAEATVIGFEELMHNANEATIDALGYTDRATCKENLQGMNTLGSLKVMDCKTNAVFSVGTGFDADQRKKIWSNRDQYLGKTITYKFQPHGVKDLPRCPVFKGFRDLIDISE